MNRFIPFLIALLFLLAGVVTSPAKKKKEKKVKKTSVTKEAIVRSEELFIKGMGHFMVGEYSKATNLFRSAKALNPNSAGIYFKLGDAYYKQGIKSQAIINLEKAIALEDNNKAYYFLLAEVLTSEYRFEEAAHVYEDMLEKVNGTNEFYLDLAKIYFHLGVSGQDVDTQEKDKNQYLHKAIEAYENAEKYYGVEQEIIRAKQQIYLKLNKQSLAIKEGEKLIEKYPQDITAWIYLADIKYTNGDKKGAIEDLNKLLENPPKEAALAHLQLFDYYTKDKKTEESFHHMEKAFDDPSLGLELKAKLLEQYFYRKLDDNMYRDEAIILAEKLVTSYSDKAISHAVNGDILYLSDFKEKARDSYIKSLALDESKYVVWEQVVRIETDMQLADSVVKHADDALEIFPNQPSLWLYKGIGHNMLEDNENAALAFEHGKKITLENKELEGLFNAQLGDSYNSLEQYDKADQSYESALSVDPNNAHVLNNYSYYLSLRKEKLKKALVMSERLVKLYPEEVTYLDTYAWVLYQMEDYQKAETFLKKAVQDSDNGTILEHYGDVLFRLGKKDEAIKYWNKAKEKGETTEFLDRKISDEQLYE